MKKVMFISSMGGHLTEMMQLKSIFKEYDYKIVTEKHKSTITLKSKYKSNGRRYSECGKIYVYK